MASLKESTMTTEATQAPDPVCGMTVDIAYAAAAGLTTEHDGRSYFFCGKGCKLEFEDDPARYVDPS
jgi:YHS domain-containing protein